MAEIVAEMQERLLPEYEQMKKFEVCTDSQIRECIKQRERCQARITQSEKSMRDYANYILLEKKMHKWVSEKERVHGTKLAGLKTSIATRIILLYREGLSHFPYEERFWENYVHFCKKSVPHEVSGIYEKMLGYHADKPGIWCDAALWMYEYSMNMSRVKDIFFRALQNHPDSEAINKTFFDIMLMEASKMNTERSGSSNISEQDIGLERVEVVYHNSKKKISNVAYFLQLLERCEEEKFSNITVRLQKLILDDLMVMFPREEALWDLLAQRELRGFNMNDLRNVEKSEPTVTATANTLNAALANVENTKIDTEAQDEEMQDVKDTSIKGVWQKRTLKRRIELCCSVYQTAARTLETPQMWTYYINAMLKLNQDMSTQQVLKRKRLAIAFKEGHESGLMSVDHYCTFIHMLLESPGEGGIQLAESVLSEALKLHKSPKLYEVWLSTHIVDNNEAKVYEIFRKANADLGTAQCFSLWRLTLQFYMTRYDDFVKRLAKLYKEASQQLIPEFGVFRGEYLEFCVLNMSMQRTRTIYDEMCQLPPPCLELHQKMATLESQLAVKTEVDFERWRLCHENAVHYFGKTHPQTWLDYITFERDHGEAKRMSILCERAQKTLDSKLVDNFISGYTLLTKINMK